MTPGALHRWSRLAEERGRKYRKLPPASMLALLACVAAGGLGAVQFHTSLSTPNLGLWLIGLSVVVLWNMFAAPYRLYWRKDSMLLARLPISGRELVATAARTSLRAVCLSVAPFAVYIAAAVGVVPPQGLAKLFAVVGLGLVCALALAPAATIMAGVMTSSSRAQAAVRSLVSKSAGARVEVPAATWMGLLPGLAGTAYVVGVVFAYEWLAGGAGIGAGVLLGGIATLGVLLWLSVKWVADDTLTQAVRDMAALDRQRLAHVDRSTASPFERLWAAVSPGMARIIMDKDFRLGRRRYPLPYALAAAALVAIWICAAVGGVQAFSVAVGAYAALQLAAMTMARRLMEVPIERRRLLLMLPFSTKHITSAKRGHAMFRSLTGSALALVPLCVRYNDSAQWIPLVASAIVIAGACAWLVSRPS